MSVLDRRLEDLLPAARAASPLPAWLARCESCGRRNANREVKPKGRPPLRVCGWCFEALRVRDPDEGLPWMRS